MGSASWRNGFRGITRSCWCSLHHPGPAFFREQFYPLQDDVPSRVGAPHEHAVLGRLDSAENILANKLTALVDRREPKDLADVWGFCCKMGLPLEAALEGAQGKAVGLFAPDVARPLLEGTREDWTLVRWIDAPEPAQWLSDLRTLGERLLLISR